LGGSNGDYVYSRLALARLSDAIRSLGMQGASLLITPSRRTEPGIVETAKNAARQFPHVFWDMRGGNPYQHFLAHAEAFAAPAYSINMTGEPCATGRPVYVFHPDGGSPKFRRFHEALTRHGATRSISPEFETIETWNYEPLNSASAIAREI